MKVTPRLAITAVFAAFGVISGLWSGSVPTLTRQLGLDSAQLGVIFTLYMLANVLAMTFGAPLARQASNRRMLLAVVPCMTMAAVAVQASQTVWMFVPALLLLGLCQGLCDLFMNAEGTAAESDFGRPILTRMHGFVALAGAICAILGSLIAARFGTAMSAPLIVLAGLVGTWVVWRGTPDRHPKAGAVATVSRAWNYAPLVLLGVAVGFENAGEIAALLWSAKLLDEAAPALAAIAGIGPAFYSACSAVVRLNGDGIRARFGDRSVVIGSLLVAATGFVGVGATGEFVPRVISFAIIGFGTACVIPCLYAMAANSDPNARASRLGFVSMIAGPPRVLSPMLFGWISLHTSIGLAFGLCSVMIIGALVMFLASHAIMRQPAVGRVSA